MCNFEQRDYAKKYSSCKSCQAMTLKESESGVSKNLRPSFNTLNLHSTILKKNDEDEDEQWDKKDHQHLGDI